ncbi:MAG: hypothetical protein ABI267_05075 [Ginsengibacter sp.]
MKLFITAILLCSFLGMKAQDTNTNAKNNKEEVDSVFQGQLLIDKTNNTKIYLTGFKQTIDSTSTYTTVFTFGAKLSRTTFDVNIKMKFHQPILSDGPIGFEYGPVGTGRFSGSGAVRENNIFLYFQGQITASTHHFFIKIKSKQKVRPLVAGLEGQANF